MVAAMPFLDVRVPLLNAAGEDAVCFWKQGVSVTHGLAQARCLSRKHAIAFRALHAKCKLARGTTPHFLSVVKPQPGYA